MKTSLITLVLLLFVIAPQITHAQQAQTNLCQQLVRQALEAATTNCLGLGPNQICYAFGDVAAEFAAAGVTFDQPGDRADLTQLRSLRAAPLDPASGTWGVAVLNLWADLPASEANNTLTMAVLGGVTLTNGVNPASAVLPAGSPVAVTLAGVNATVFQTPSPDVPVGVVTGQQALNADGFSADRQWLRVDFRHQTADGATRPAAWLRVSDAAPDAALDALPIVEGLTPMQAFAADISSARAACSEGDAGLLLLGPDNTPVTVVMNGLELVISSGLQLSVVPFGAGLGLEITVAEGGVVLPGPPQVVIPGGFTVTIPFTINADGSITFNPGGATSPQVLTPEQLAGLALLLQLVTVSGQGVSIPTIITVSGVGGPQVQVNATVSSQVASLCAAGSLPQSVCQALGLPFNTAP